MTAPEPSLVFQSVLLWIVPYVIYYFGIWIRKKIFPGKNSPPLFHQFLVAIPISVFIVTPLIGILHKSISVDIPTYVTTMAVILEHGMFFHEFAAERLKKGKYGNGRT